MRLENRLRSSRRSRGPGDESRIGLVEGADPLAGRTPAASITAAGAVEESTWSSSAAAVVGWPARTPPRPARPRTWRRRTRAVGQLDDHRLAGPDAGGPQLRAEAGGLGAGGAGRDRQVRRADQVLAVGKGVRGQQVRQIARGPGRGVGGRLGHQDILSEGLSRPRPRADRQLYTLYLLVSCRQ